MRLLAQAMGMFVVTNIDGMLVLVMFFGQARDSRAAVIHVVAGTYLGFAGILGASVFGALGAELLAGSTIAYLGVLPLLLGVRAAWSAWRQHRDGDPVPGADHDSPSGGAAVGQVATVTLANGGDNLSVYIPVFAVAGRGNMTVYAGVFLAGVAVWCAVGRFLATRPLVARALSRCGNVLMPFVLLGIGALSLIRGGAFGL